MNRGLEEKWSIREISRVYRMEGKIAVCLLKTDDLPWAKGWRPAMLRLVAEWLMTE